MYQKSSDRDNASGHGEHDGDGGEHDYDVRALTLGPGGNLMGPFLLQELCGHPCQSHQRASQVHGR